MPNFVKYAGKYLLVICIACLSCLANAEITTFRYSTYLPEADKDNVNVILSNGQFTPLRNSTFQRGEWLKIEWDKDQLNDETLLINDFASQALEDYYLVKNNKVVQRFQNGHQRDFSSRPVEHVKSVIPISDADFVLYHPCCNPIFPADFRLLSTEELNQQSHADDLWYAVAYAIIGVMFLYNLVIFSSLRENRYLYYCYHLLAATLFQLGWSGLGKQFLWPDVSQTQLILLFNTVNSTIASMLFSLAFLNKKQLSFFNRRLMQVTIMLNTLPLVIYFLSPLWDSANALSNVSGQLLALLAWVITDYVIIRNILAGDRTAWALLISYLGVNIAGVTSILRYNGVIESHFLSEQAILLAIVFEAIVLSLALAQKIQILREASLQAKSEKLQTQQLFARRLLHVQEEEKKQLGNALHDGFTHQLLQLKSAIDTKLGKQTSESKMVIGVLDGIRDLSHLCHPHMLEELGLKLAITDMITRANQRHTVDIDVIIDDIFLTDEQSLLVYRIIQGSLNNVIQHADANECLIVVQLIEEQKIQVIIKDDGKGFDVKATTDGLGLKTLRERSQILGGTLVITADEDGTLIHLTFPSTGDQDA